MTARSTVGMVAEMAPGLSRPQVRMALDTNVLVYAEGFGDYLRCQQARELLGCFKRDDVVIPAQVLGELARVLIDKAKRPPRQVREHLLEWADAFAIADSTWEAMQAAFDLNVEHKVPIWDALILSVAATQRCRLLLSEDFHDGFLWRGVTVTNPFATKLHPLLQDVVGTRWDDLQLG